MAEPVPEKAARNGEPRRSVSGGSSGAADARSGAGLRYSPWNLLLLLPFLMLITPWINADEPRLWGMPFFYWIQFAFVPVGVAAVAVVYLKTRDDAPVAPGVAPDVDELDEGTAGGSVAR
jgi:Protein of unknown function (DUF3311)